MYALYAEIMSRKTYQQTFWQRLPGKPVFKADIYPVEEHVKWMGFYKKARVYCPGLYDYKGMLLLRKGQNQ